ncbi:hypothetical protein BJY01DRAFT_234487 [Aspergillus pseudoustus]|uniref:DUF3500 domain-containing protein n=1 Tax=Aspergillus pseudoustus TaxID=1810923 RepID=A0ABR4K377_9EURO
MASRNFRAWMPNFSLPKFQGISQDTALSWRDKSLLVPHLQELINHWCNLREVPFKGVTTNGELLPNVYAYEDQGIDSGAIAEAAHEVFNLCKPGQIVALRQPLNSKTWRSWSNPEIYFSNYGLRLEELEEDLIDAILRVIQRTLSPEGYEKVTNARYVNHFLGDLCDAHGVMNEYSYNFQVFGEPSDETQWGWSIYGHHLCMSTFINRKHLHIAPTFIGAEPNEIDQGPHAGVTMMKPEESLGLALMQSLTTEQQALAQSYKEMHDPEMPPGRFQRADQRHLCGAFQDNRVVPYEGIKATEFSESQIKVVLEIFNQFLIYLPERSRQSRLEQLRRYLPETYFSWIGGFQGQVPFYYRIQSPAIIVEFDHHSGVFLSNTQPERFHIHTVMRAPNGGDYGNDFRASEDRVL